MQSGNRNVTSYLITSAGRDVVCKPRLVLIHLLHKGDPVDQHAAVHINLDQGEGEGLYTHARYKCQASAGVRA